MILMTLIDTQKERDLFNVLYEKYRRLMFQVAMGVLGESYLAEDAVHEAFIKVAGHMEMVDSADSNRTKRFMITVAKNAAIDLYRRNRKLYQREISVEDYDECTDAIVYQETEEDDEIPELLRSLPAIYRDVFLLKYSALYENHEIAKILDIPEGTVRQRIARGKAMVTKQLEERNGNTLRWQEQTGT